MERNQKENQNHETNWEATAQRRFILFRRIRMAELSMFVLGLLFAFIFVYPLYFTLISSFKSNSEIWGTMFALPKEWLIENYVQAIGNIGILKAIGNSLVLSIGSTALVLVLVSMVSYVIARNLLRVSRFIRLYLLIGLMIPAFSMLIPVYILFSSMGLKDNRAAMIFLYAGISIPMSSFIITGFMKSISKEIDESARIDGCGVFRFVFQIMIPLSLPAISTAGIIAFLGIYNELVYAMVLLSKKNLYTISVALLTARGQNFSSMGPAFAAIVLSIIPMMMVYLLFQERVEKGISSGAVKG